MVQYLDLKEQTQRVDVVKYHRRLFPTSDSPAFANADNFNKADRFQSLPRRESVRHSGFELNAIEVFALPNFYCQGSAFRVLNSHSGDDITAPRLEELLTSACIDVVILGNGPPKAKPEAS